LILVCPISIGQSLEGEPQATITAQAGQIATLQAATGTATVPSLDDDEAGVFPYGPQVVYEGSTNTSIGTDALDSLTTGSGNTASGASALTYNTTGSNNTASGYEAPSFLFRNPLQLSAHWSIWNMRLMSSLSTLQRRSRRPPCVSHMRRPVSGDEDAPSRSQTEDAIRGW